ncbi:unnamed protein product [Paramecium primaurelia]|uniref:G domain-containing protein n=1 Tax=Paramecium primaurelia TaxID=5886 RepID=A0A8S1NPY3_PARPR|nr:unnamed protein product [Paramecium primaurelia]
MAIVLIGPISSGKTTLYNKITLSQETKNMGGNAVTMSLFMKKSCFGSGFSVLDTKGFRQNSKKTDHIASVLSAISEGPIHRIFITTKYATTNSIVQDVEKILTTFMKYRILVTVIITFWDLCEQKELEKNKQDIQQRLAQLKINSIMFVGKNDTPESICSRIDSIIANSKAQNLVLTLKHFQQNFDLLEYDDDQIHQIEVLERESIKNYNRFFQQATQKIQNNNISKELIVDYFYAITQFAKDLFQQTIKKFEVDIQQIIEKLGESEQFKACEIHFKLKNAIFQQYEQIVQLTHQKTHNGKNLSQYIRKCYHCGQIWFKADGCEGNTVCGSLNENHQDYFLQEEEALRIFKVTYLKENLEVFLDNSLKQNDVVLDEKKKQNQIIDEKFKLGGVGCKKIINWSDMKPLTEEEMNVILGILDIQLCEKMAYKNDLDLKLLEQKTNMKKTA